MDIQAAIAMAMGDPRLDENNIILAGWSHGAWSIMDYLTFDLKNESPAGIIRAQNNMADPAGTILFYPYCGLGARLRFSDWKIDLPTQVFIAGKDTMVRADQCLKLLKGVEKQTTNFNLTLYEDADHVFDDPFMDKAYQYMYNHDYHRDAADKFTAFLADRLDGS